MGASTHETLSRSLTGRYDLVRELGRGGMSTVYLARDVRHGREVAIKVLLPELAASLGAERFLREIRVVARLQHPHILPLFDSGEVQGLLYFVMPFVEGESLRARLEREGALEVVEATRLVRQLADALDYAHQRGVVHRDLKPENILLTGGQALLADFGVARAQGGAVAGDGATLTSVGIALGTPAYMSPEQAAGEREVDARSDVYALGCVTHEMLAGEPPFRGANAMSLIRQHLTSPPPPLAGKRAITPDVGAAVSRALAKEPGDRFASAGGFAAALEQARTPSPDDVRLRAVEQGRAARKRVLVLDFANIAGAVDVDWLSTGIVESVSADLGKIAEITVVAQDAASRRRIEAARQGRPVDASLAAEIGRALDARWVVWGAFQKFGPRIRITPHFMDVTAGTLVGGDKVDGLMDDIFALQDRIVTGVAEALKIELTSGEVERIARPETVHLGAYEHYARGYRAYLQFGRESVKVAAEHFRAAIAIDGDYALAHAGLGVIHAPMYIATGRRDVLDEGTRLLERAIELDPTIGEAHAWLSYMQMRQNRFDDGERTARKGIERNPAADMCWYMLGCSYVGRTVGAHDPAALARAVPPLLRSIALNPTHTAAPMILGSVYMLRGRYSHAAALIDRATALETGGSAMAFLGAYVQRAALHLGAGDAAAAAPLLDDAIGRYTGADHVYADTMCAYAHVIRGCLAERVGRLNDAGEDFLRACEIADANEHRISIGAHWLKARFGLTRVLHRLGQVAAAETAYAEASELEAARSRFIWTWFVGAADADVLYEQGSALAVLGRTGEALDTLRRAADAGWADVTWLRSDPAFAALRDTAAVQRLCTQAAARVVLPPPVGSGGLS